jgi:hypothetical protein
MQISNLAKYAAGVTVAAALLAGCSSGGSSALSPSSTGMQNAVTPGHLQTLKVGGLFLASAMLPQVKPIQIAPAKHHKKKSDDEYVSNFYGSELLVFDYPKGDASTGTVTGVTDAQGECTQTGKKNFWVVASGADEIEEFAFGGTTPISTLSESTGEPAGCAIDAKTNDMAVTILGTADVVIFTGSKGTGTTVSDGLSSSYFDTYDKAGDLFVDGITSGGSAGVVEEAAGSSSFKAVTTSNSIVFPGEMQWDGKFVTLNDQSGHAIYQYACASDACTLDGTVALNGTSDCVQTWISGKLVYCPDFPNEDTVVFKYPAGGSSIATLTGSYDGPIGSVAIAK